MDGDLHADDALELVAALFQAARLYEQIRHARVITEVYRLGYDAGREDVKHAR